MISICMATYNGERFIREQLDSILKQISENDELIISDDGSTDNTIQIIEYYAKIYNNIKLVRGPQLGVVKNFEYALKRAKGDIIFLSDQDDIWADSKVKKTIETLKKADTILVLHDAYIVNQAGNVVFTSFFNYRGSKTGYINNIIKNSYLGCCMAFRKQLLEVVLPFPEKIEMHDWWIGLLGERIGKVKFLNDKLLYYRRHDKNVSSFHHHPLNKMIINRVRLIIETTQRLKEIGIL